MSTDRVVLINVFNCTPDKQEELTRLLTNLTGVMTELEGYVSSSLHASLDGRHVANYAVWESEDHWRSMVRNPRIQARMEGVLKLATFDPKLYRETSRHQPT